MAERFLISGWIDVQDEFGDLLEQNTPSQCQNMKDAVNLMEGFIDMDISLTRTSP